MRLSQLLSEFLSTPSGWRATVVLVALFPRCFNFYPRPPGGGRPFCISKDICVYNFYPRPPGGGRLSHSMFPRTAETISIHALRVEGDKIAPFVKHLHYISIHALRVEGDHQHSTRIRPRCNFYPRPPGGGRPRGNFHGLYIEIFLSTPSGWRATRAFHTVTRRSDYFYPRPPGGGRQLDGASKGYGAAISIHALRVEGDGTMMRFFPSTNSHFYPRPPGGGRLVVATGQATVVAFLSTPSGWRAT